MRLKAIVFAALSRPGNDAPDCAEPESAVSDAITPRGGIRGNSSQNDRIDLFCFEDSPFKPEIRTVHR